MPLYLASLCLHSPISIKVSANGKWCARHSNKYSLQYQPCFLCRDATTPCLQRQFRCSELTWQNMLRAQHTHTTVVIAPTYGI